MIAGVLGMTLVSMQVFAGDYIGAVTKAAGLQARVMWCDAEANLWALDTREKVAQLANQCKDANINVIVVDVKPAAGVVLYNSLIAPKLKTWSDRPYPEGYDLLQTMVEEGHRVGIEVYPSINVFSEAVTNRKEGGAALAHPEWQCVKYDVDRWAVGPSSSTHPIDGVNRMPLVGRLALINDPKAISKTLPAGAVLASIDSSGTVTAISDQSSECATIPSGGYILLGSDGAGAWLRANAAPGGKMTIEGKPLLVPMSKSADEHYAVFVNPADPSVKAYELSIINEIVTNYDIDGIVLDRMRYPGIYADFSDCSRTAFEEWLGCKVENFPQDIMTIDPIPGRDLIRGKYFAKWMEWRARQIHDFLAEARQIVKTAKPKALIGAYVGSWYDSYYDVGVNWAGPRHDPPYDFACPTYKETGFADMLDWLCTGCYCAYPTRKDAVADGAGEEASVEAAAEQSINVVEDDTFVYGSLYLLQYTRNPDAFEQAIATLQASTQGVMLFDLVYIREYNWWDILKRTFATPSKAPHTVPGLVDKIKDVRQFIEESGK